MATAAEERARAREEERENIYGTTREEREVRGNGSTATRVFRHEMFDDPTYFRSLDDREDIALGSMRGILGSMNRIWFGGLQMQIELLTIAEDASRRSLMVMGR